MVKKNPKIKIQKEVHGIGLIVIELSFELENDIKEVIYAIAVYIHPSSKKERVFTINKLLQVSSQISEEKC